MSPLPMPSEGAIWMGRSGAALEIPRLFHTDVDKPVENVQNFFGETGSDVVM